MHILGMRGHAAAHLRLLAVHAPEGPAADEPVHDDLAFVLGAAQIIFVLNFFLSMRRGKVAGPNPWHANTLEWQTALAAAARELRRARPDGLPRPLRVQRSRARPTITGRRTSLRRARPGAPAHG